MHHNIYQFSFRNQIKKESQHGAAEIEERALKLREVVKTREKMLRDFEDCIEIEHGKRKFNFDKIYAVFNKELNDKNRLLSKLKDKNKVAFLWLFYNKGLQQAKFRYNVLTL